MSKHSKTLETLLARAERKGEANKNGRYMVGYWGDVSPLREQWHVTDDGSTLTVRHWGTQIIKANKKEHTVVDVYGQSNSDRDALNQIFEYLGIKMHAHYYPSRETLEVHGDNTERLIYAI